MKSDLTEGGLPSNLELTGNRLLLDRTLVSGKLKFFCFIVLMNHFVNTGVFLDLATFILIIIYLFLL